MQQSAPSDGEVCRQVVGCFRKKKWGQSQACTLWMQTCALALCFLAAYAPVAVMPQICGCPALPVVSWMIT